MTFNLTQAIIDKSPPGLIVTPGIIPERSAAILLELAEEAGHAQGQDRRGARRHDRVDRRERHDRARAEEARREARDRPRSSTSAPRGDTTAAQAQLDSFIEKWKTEDVDTRVPLGRPRLDEAVRAEGQAGVARHAAARRQHRHARPGAAGAEVGRRSRTRTRASITAGGLSPQEYDASDELEVLRRHLPGGDRQGPRERRRRSSRPRTARSTTRTARSTTRARRSRCSTTSASGSASTSTTPTG